MTVYKFDLETEPEDMEAEDLRETISDFMEKHEENLDEIDALKETLSEYEDVDLDSLRDTAGKVDTVKREFAEQAASAFESDIITAEHIASEYSLEQTIQLAGEAEESEETEDSEAEFEEREEKGRAKGDTVSFDEETDEALGRIMG